ncbi:putative glutamate receptor [Tachypleus tridentatus]|uniref:putative glutamate receptor n=1 Tax=Tachypleus tridentatus TaxID=6853 RepID=UPI003FCF2C77
MSYINMTYPKKKNVVSCLFSLLVYLTLISGYRYQNENSELSDVIYSVLRHQNWTDVLIVNAPTKGTSLLIENLFHQRIKATIINLSYVPNFKWPRNQGMLQNYQGYVFLARNEKELKVFMKRIQNLDLFGPRNPWVLSCGTMISDVANYKTYLTEGDKVMLLVKTSTEMQNECSNEPHKSLQGSQENCETNTTFKIWSSYSPGDGNIIFHQKGTWFKNLGIKGPHDLFFPPFIKLQNRTLRVTSLGGYPVRQKPQGNSTQWSGYMFTVVNALAEILNFSYSVQDPKEKHYGIKSENGSWNGLIGELTRGVADMAVADLSWDVERAQVVDFTYPVFYETTKFIYKSPSFLSRAWILFEPYSVMLWITLVFAMLVLGIVMFLFTFVYSNISENETSSVVELVEQCLENSYRQLVIQGCAWLPETASSRIVMAAWWFTMVIFSSVYSGNLTSTLSLKKTESPVNTLEGFTSKYPSFQLVVSNGSLAHSYFKRSEYFRTLWETNIQYGVLSLDDGSIMKLVRNGSVAWINEEAMMDYKMRQLSDGSSTVCDFYIAKEELFPSNWAIAFQYDSPFRKIFNKYIFWLNAMGITERWRDKFWTVTNSSCRLTDGINKQDLVPININETVSVFVILGIGHCLSFIVFLAEIFLRKSK